MIAYCQTCLALRLVLQAGFMKGGDCQYVIGLGLMASSQALTELSYQHLNANAEAHTCNEKGVDTTSNWF